MVQPSPNEVQRLVKEEFDRRRKLRYEQVRLLARRNAVIVHNRVNDGVEQRKQVLAAKLKNELIRKKEDMLQTLREEFECAKNMVGQGHIDATDRSLNDDKETIQRKYEATKAKQLAMERFNEALDQLKTAQTLKIQHETAAIVARKKALEVEKVVSTKIAQVGHRKRAEQEQYDKEHPVVETKRIPKVDMSNAYATTLHHVVKPQDKAAAVHSVSADESKKLVDAVASANTQAVELAKKQLWSEAEKQRREISADSRGRNALEKQHACLNRANVIKQLEKAQQQYLSGVQRRSLPGEINRRVFVTPAQRIQDERELQARLEGALHTARIAGDTSVNLVDNITTMSCDDSSISQTEEDESQPNTGSVWVEQPDVISMPHVNTEDESQPAKQTNLLFAKPTREEKIARRAVKKSVAFEIGLPMTRTLPDDSETSVSTSASDRIDSSERKIEADARAVDFGDDSAPWSDNDATCTSTSASSTLVDESSGDTTLTKTSGSDGTDTTGTEESATDHTATSSTSSTEANGTLTSGPLTGSSKHEATSSSSSSRAQWSASARNSKLSTGPLSTDASTSFALSAGRLSSRASQAVDDSLEELLRRHLPLINAPVAPLAKPSGSMSSPSSDSSKTLSAGQLTHDTGEDNGEFANITVTSSRHEKSTSDSSVTVGSALSLGSLQPPSDHLRGQAPDNRTGRAPASDRTSSTDESLSSHSFLRLSFTHSERANVRAEEPQRTETQPQPVDAGVAQSVTGTSASAALPDNEELLSSLLERLDRLTSIDLFEDSDPDETAIAGFHGNDPTVNYAQITQQDHPLLQHVHHELSTIDEVDTPASASRVLLASLRRSMAGGDNSSKATRMASALSSMYASLPGARRPQTTGDDGSEAGASTSVKSNAQQLSSSVGAGDSALPHHTSTPFKTDGSPPKDDQDVPASGGDTATMLAQHQKRLQRITAALESVAMESSSTDVTEDVIPHGELSVGALDSPLSKVVFDDETAGTEDRDVERDLLAELDPPLGEGVRRFNVSTSESVLSFERHELSAMAREMEEHLEDVDRPNAADDQDENDD